MYHSDVVRRHERSHHEQQIEQQAEHQARQHLEESSNSLPDDSVMLTPASAAESLRRLSEIPGITSMPENMTPLQYPNTSIASLAPPNTGYIPGMDLSSQDDTTHRSSSNSGPGTWFLEDDFDVSALDFSLTSTISEWAQFSNPFPAPLLPTEESPEIFTPVQSFAPNLQSPNPPGDAMKRKWFSHMEHRPSRGFDMAESSYSGHTKANESYRADLSQKLRPRMEDEALPTSEQLNLFAKLYFHRFHPLLPVIHTPSFRPTAENSLLFLSLCSIGSLFVGSSRAVMQGSRIFERLNKAILASWESFLSQSRPDALSMVQAAILGQTYAILAGEPKYLVLADVLHGTVAAWAREANRLGSICTRAPDLSDDSNIETSWYRWIDHEQRARVQVALHIHDAELATLLHHQPIRSHRFRQFPKLASDELFSAPTASKWAAMYRQSMNTSPENDLVSTQLPRSLDPLPVTGVSSRFAAYGLLESISARLVDAKQSDGFDHHVSAEISSLLIAWWKAYYTPIQSHERDPFCLPVLWHSIYISLYADLDLLEQLIGRDGYHHTVQAAGPVQEWCTSLNASRCLIHASLIAQYIENMSMSSEPSIHVPRALFSAALTYLVVARFAPKHVVRSEAFSSPEFKILGDINASVESCFPDLQSKGSSGSVVADMDHLYRLVDLLQRGGRWGISQAFAGVITSALEGIPGS
ncbi:hypothetical protein N7466_000881 [Penicillium verhagenii]|uniref:uncharacterized protein n=1 Tax=Penicillium verhagenii TaxID=1562060 RepID=UPI002545B10F|nr:uncharacterized protein N7466_000881 [Penicillium verhagenii]KAJ5947866.1 hypothetical protein N7466_000881 [Penicillium verhagenii]